MLARLGDFVPGDVKGATQPLMGTGPRATELKFFTLSKVWRPRDGALMPRCPAVLLLPPLVLHLPWHGHHVQARGKGHQVEALTVLSLLWDMRWEGSGPSPGGPGVRTLMF